MNEKTCYGCFRERAGAFCPYCGYNPDTADHPYLALPLGTLLNGRYVTGKALGMGGFGITYLGYDTTLDIKVAIKEYLPSGLAVREADGYSLSLLSKSGEESYLEGAERFLDEARILAKLRHIPNIVTVQNYFRENNTAYFVMDYVEGVSLKEYLNQKGGRISFAEAQAFLLPIGEALFRVHGEGLLHRDISPDNIYITSSGESRLLDFGAARFALGSDKSISVILKKGFAPEEQYRTRGNQGPWTDVYALGATLYTCLTGTLPPDSIDRLHEDALLPPSALGVFLPAYAEQALLKALAVKAENRFQTMGEFTRALGGQASSAPLPGTLPDYGASLNNAPAGPLPASGAGVFGNAPIEGSVPPMTEGVKKAGRAKFGKKQVLISLILLVVAVTAVVLPLSLSGKKGSGPLPTGSSSVPVVAPVGNIPYGHAVYRNAERDFSLLYCSDYECLYEEQNGCAVYLDRSAPASVFINRLFQTGVTAENYFKAVQSGLSSYPGFQAGEMQQYFYGGRQLPGVLYQYTLSEGGVSRKVRMLRLMEVLSDSCVAYTALWGEEALGEEMSADLTAALGTAVSSFRPSSSAYDKAAVEANKGTVYENKGMGFSLTLDPRFTVTNDDTGLLASDQEGSGQLMAFFTQSDGSGYGAVYSAKDAYTLAGGDSGWLAEFLTADYAAVADKGNLPGGGYRIRFNGTLWGENVQGELRLWDAEGEFGCYAVMYAVSTGHGDFGKVYALLEEGAATFKKTGSPGNAEEYYKASSAKLGAVEMLYSPNLCGTAPEEVNAGLAFYPSGVRTDNLVYAEVLVSYLGTSYGTEERAILEALLAEDKDYFGSGLQVELGGDFYSVNSGRADFTARDYNYTYGDQSFGFSVCVGKVGSDYYSVSLIIPGYEDSTDLITLGNQILWSLREAE